MAEEAGRGHSGRASPAGERVETERGASSAAAASAARGEDGEDGDGGGGGGESAPPNSNAAGSRVDAGAAVPSGADAETVDCECALCYAVYLQPVRTPCEHTYCRTCISDSMKYKKSCPMCRASLDGFDPARAAVVEHLQRYVEEHHGEELRAHAEDVEREEARRAAILRIVVDVGNTHVELDNPGHRHRPRRSTRNHHRWTMFVRCSSHPDLDLSRYIKCVKFQLHESFSQNRITRRHAPYEVRREGWGTFEVGVTIVWRRGARVDGECRQTLEHDLSFDGDGAHSSEVVELARASDEGADGTDVAAGAAAGAGGAGRASGVRGARGARGGTSERSHRGPRDGRRGGRAAAAATRESHSHARHSRARRSHRPER